MALAGLALAALVPAAAPAQEPNEPGARGGALDTPAAPSGEAAEPAPPTSPAEEEAARRAELDALLARLAAPDARDWRRTEQRIWRLWAQSGSATIDLLLARAGAALQAGDSDLALAFLDDAVRLAPDFAEAWNRRAAVHFARGELGRALADIRRVLALEPRHFGALAGLGVILERLGDKRGAWRAFEAALAINPHLDEARRAAERLAPEARGRPL